jgi:hypothetical protein
VLAPLERLGDLVEHAHGLSCLSSDEGEASRRRDAIPVTLFWEAALE